MFHIPASHSRRTIAILLATTLAALLLGVLRPGAAWAATSTDPNACQAPKVASLSCVNSPAARRGPTTSSGPATAQQGSGGGGVSFGEAETPEGWAGPIAKDLGQGVQGLAGDLAKRIKNDGLLPQFEFSQGYLSVYAIMFGLGVIIAALATMLATVKVAASKGVDARIMAHQGLLRLVTFSAVGGLAPLLLALLGQLSRALAGGFFDLAADEFSAQLTGLAKALTVGSLASLIVPGGSAVMVGLFIFLLVSLAAIFLELMASHFLIFLLALLIPILYAASINPDWRGGVRRVSGALLGAFLAPSALFLVWVVTFAAVPAWGTNQSFFTRAGVLIVGLLLSLAAPVAIGMLLSYVVPVFAGGSSYDTSAFGTAAARLNLRGGAIGQTGARASRAKRASAARDAGPAGQQVESATGAARGATSGGVGAASAAGGPVAAAVGLWTRMAGKTRRSAEDAQQTVGAAAERTTGGESGGSTQRSQIGDPSTPLRSGRGNGQAPPQTPVDRPDDAAHRSPGGAATGGGRLRAEARTPQKNADSPQPPSTDRPGQDPSRDSLPALRPLAAPQRQPDQPGGRPRGGA